MARPSKNPPAPAESTTGWGRSLRRLAWRPGFLALVAVVALITLCGPAIRKLAPSLEYDPAYQLPSRNIEITQSPFWVPHNLVEQVIERANLPRELSLLDDNLTRDIAQAFALHPWVEEVQEVTKTFPPAVRVHLVYRRPVAMVQVKQGLYPVDLKGVLLPPQDFSPANARQYPLILGIVSTPQGPAGNDWGDPVVAEAARLAGALAGLWKKLALAAIVCPRGGQPAGIPGAEGYILTTAGGSQVLWGRGPDADHPGELSTEQKIGRLEEYASKFGGLDGPQGKYRIDIRHWRDIYRTPQARAGAVPDSARH